MKQTACTFHSFWVDVRSLDIQMVHWSESSIKQIRIHFISADFSHMFIWNHPEAEPGWSCAKLKPRLRCLRKKLLSLYVGFKTEFKNIKFKKKKKN